MGDSARLSTEAERNALADLLATVSPVQLAAVAQDLFSFMPLPPMFDWHDGRAVVERISAMTSPVARVPPLVLYAVRLSHETGRPGPIGFGPWADAAARTAGMTEPEIRDLFARTATASRDRKAAPATETGRYPDQTFQVSPNPRSESALHTQHTVTETATTTRKPSESGRIWGNVPPRNPTFTGRESLLLELQRSLESRAKASVLPHALHGSGGVGKSQLAVEFAYRFSERYDLVWWVPAEQQTLVLQSLADLGRQLGIPVTPDFTQAASLVLEALATTSRRWLLIFDNATDPDELVQLIPRSGGHVILTSRSEAWLDVWDAIKVDVFERDESIELVQRRGADISAEDADQLAQRLRDLPLALDQAAAWQKATRTPIADYLAQLDRHYAEFVAQGRQIGYPASIAVLVKLVLERLQESAPAVAQLFEMFAVFGAEPVSVDLLHLGRFGEIGQPLGRALRESITRDRIVRELRTYGLAKVDVGERIQVHRLFQVALRDVLSEERIQQSRVNVHRLLGVANPGNPSDQSDVRLHAEIAPHVTPSGLIESDERDAWKLVLDQIRYLWVVGDNEGSRRLGEAALESWRRRTDEPDLGADGELTLLAQRHLTTALQALGVINQARELAQKTLEGFERNFGTDHEHTLWAANVAGRGLRIDGRFQEALARDQDTYERCVRVFGEEDSLTLRNRGNVAVGLRMVSDFQQAAEIDEDIVRILADTLMDDNRQLLFARSNLVRDRYGLGDYAEALQLQQIYLPVYRRTMATPLHPEVLLATRTLAMALRKTGQYEEALKVARENYRDSVAVFGEAHEHALAATMTYANSLRATGGLDEARGLAADAVTRYRRTYGEEHPLTLAALVNTAVIERAKGNVSAAHRLDESAHRTMRAVLGPEHGYTLCAASGLANDLALAGDAAGAHQLSRETLATSRTSRGPQHPYTLLCVVNAAFDEAAVGDVEHAGTDLAAAIDELAEQLGHTHPEVLDVQRGKRAECDIEPPPT